MQVDVVECLALGVLGVLEAHMVEVDRAVRDLVCGLGGVRDGGLGVQHLDDTVRALLGHGDHHEDHGELHEAHEDLESVGEGGGELAHVEQSALAGDDELGTQVDDDDEGTVDAQVHHRVVEGEQLLGAGEVGADVFGGAGELLLLIVLTHVALDHAHAGHVLLDRLVERVVLAEHAGEDRPDPVDDESQTAAEQRDHGQVDKGDVAAHGVGHGKGEYQDERRADGDADDEHERLLHVGDVGGEARHERRAREAVDVGERERLDLVEQVVAQVLGKTAACVAAGDARRRTEEQRDEREAHENAGRGHDLCDLRTVFDGVDEVGRDKGNRHFAGDLAQHQDRCGNGRQLVIANR